MLAPHGTDSRSHRAVARTGFSGRRATSLLGALAISLSLGMGAVTGAAQSARLGATASQHWKVVPTPNPARTEVDDLASVSCHAASACIAVGSSAKTLSSPTLPLAERWDGKRWRLQTMRGPKGTSDTLYGVSCSSRHACVAVGSAYYLATRRQTTLIEVWGGRRWRVKPTRTGKAPNSALHAVSCVSRSACTAVGYSQGSKGARAIVETWNGKSWRTAAIPRSVRSTAFMGVFCSRARSCTAVGYGKARPLALAWDGKTWRARAMALPKGALQGELDSVSCTAPRACTATGTYVSQLDYGLTLAERWNGRSWRVQRTPKPPDWTASYSQIRLDSVSCTSATACTAAGFYAPGHPDYFIDSWDGKTWHLLAAPHPADFARGALLGISCATGRCAAVGAYSGGALIQSNLGLTD